MPAQLCNDANPCRDGLWNTRLQVHITKEGEVEKYTRRRIPSFRPKPLPRFGICRLSGAVASPVTVTVTVTAPVPSSALIADMYGPCHWTDLSAMERQTDRVGNSRKLGAVSVEVGRRYLMLFWSPSWRSVHLLRSACHSSTLLASPQVPACPRLFASRIRCFEFLVP